MGFPKVVSDVVSPGKLSAFEAILIISFPLWVLKQARGGREVSSTAALVRAVEHRMRVRETCCFLRCFVLMPTPTQATNVLQLQFSAKRLAKHG